MATVTHKIETSIEQASVVVWENLKNGDQGDWLEVARMADRSVQVDGTFGAGGTVVIEGTHGGSQQYTCVDPQDNPISLTVAGRKQVLDAVYRIRPRVTAGDGTTNLTVRLLLVGR